MSVALILFPLDRASDLKDERFFAEARLRMHDDKRTISQIVDLTSYGFSKPTVVTHPIPAGFSLQTYEDEGIRLRRTDVYGSKLRYAYARDLKKVEPGFDASNRSKAVIAFVRALDDDLPIILYPC